MTEGKYSMLTLEPKDITEKKQFQQFRVDQIWKKFKVYLVLYVLCIIVAVLNLIIDLSKANIISFVNNIVFALVILVAFLISKRWNKAFVWLLPVVYFLQLVILQCRVLIVEDKLDEWTVDKHMELILELLVHVFMYIYSIIFFSPSLKFTVFIYSPIYSFMHLLHMISRYDMDDAQVFNKNCVLITISIS